MKPKKWTDVYPHGTKEGDEELKFFISLARNPKYQWRSISAIAKETGLTKERVEEIVAKYYKKGMIFQNPKNEDQWGYWERCPEMLPKAEKSISAKDQDDRMHKSCIKDFDVGCMKANHIIDVKSHDQENFILSMKEAFDNKNWKPVDWRELSRAEVERINNANYQAAAEWKPIGLSKDEEFFRKKLFMDLKLPKFAGYGNKADFQASFGIKVCWLWQQSGFQASYGIK